MSTQVKAISSLDQSFDFYISVIDQKLQSITSEDVVNAAHSGLKSFEKSWKYVGKTILISRHLLNASLRSCRWIALGCKEETSQKIKTIIIRLKLFAFISVSISASAIPAQIKKLSKNLYFKDREGISLSTLSLTLLATDTFDCLTVFVNALLQTFSHPPLPWVSTLGMPMALSILGMGSLSRGIRLYHLNHFLKRLNGEVIAKVDQGNLNSKEVEALIAAFIQSNLGVKASNVCFKTELRSEVQQLKEMILERHANEKTISLVHSLAQLINKSDHLTLKQTAHILKILQKIHETLEREITFHSGYLFTNLVSFTALMLFSVPAFPMLPFLLLASSLALRIGLQIYQDIPD